MKSKVYIETSVISYLTAWTSRDLIIAANQQITQQWWKTRRENFDLFVSQLVVREAKRGDSIAAGERLEALVGIPLFEMTDEAYSLAQSLIDEKALPSNATVDAGHIGIAAVSGADFLLTWNFKHIANAAMRLRIEQICRGSGYKPPIICSPQELMEE